MRNLLRLEVGAHGVDLVLGPARRDQVLAGELVEGEVAMVRLLGRHVAMVARSDGDSPRPRRESTNLPPFALRNIS